jgi:hypothetical protein
MKPRQLWLVCALVAVILAAGVCPLGASDYKGYASPETGRKSFEVYACTDTSMDLAFKWDAPCKLMIQVKKKGRILGTVDLNTGAYINFKGGGTFTVDIWSESGSCNWEATMANVTIPGVCNIGPYAGKAGGPNGEGATGGGSTKPGGTTTGGGTKPGGTGGSVTDLDGEIHGPTADCAGLIAERVTLSEAGGKLVSVIITPDCVPQMVCFTVPPGMMVQISNINIKFGGYNCATGAKIDDPGLIVVKGCCTNNVVFSRSYYMGGHSYETGRNQFGPGSYTLQPGGGKNYVCLVEFRIYSQ